VNFRFTILSACGQIWNRAGLFLLPVPFSVALSGDDLLDLDAAAPLNVIRG